MSEIFANGSFSAPLSDIFAERSLRLEQGVETTPRVYPADDLPRPSRPKAGLGLVKQKVRN